MWHRILVYLIALISGFLSLFQFPLIQSGNEVLAADDSINCTEITEEYSDRKIVCADIAALDHILVYNRFGSFNPFGMVFALRRDLVASSVLPTKTNAEQCREDHGTDKKIEGLSSGSVRFKDCKRPRPLVLRANEGDILHVRVTNYLKGDSDAKSPRRPGFRKTFCKGESSSRNAAYESEVRHSVKEGDTSQLNHNEVACVTGDDTAPQELVDGEDKDENWPATRSVNFSVQGLFAISPKGRQTNIEFCRGLASIPPGERVDCYFEVNRIGTYFIASNAAPSGGQGDGGSIVHGLFGAVIVEKKDSEWYRSQVSEAALDQVWKRKNGSALHSRDNGIDYEKKSDDGIPILNMRLGSPGDMAREIVHSDLNANIYTQAPAATTNQGENDDQDESFREFTVFFHDELKTFYTRNFEELGAFGQLAGVRDGFAVNYGASGMGPMLLANRKGFGPAADCAECLYEEFFLTSWANGDPALLERYADDPSNVHHSYLNDEIKFRNFHAGPKETHVFHLHAHQWFAGNDSNRGGYLDSQTVVPQQGFTYDIYRGRSDNEVGKGPFNMGDWMANGSSGNRNRTAGDSIFHCHLYPHFAQGMWALWRVHDVLEDGSRLLPDGQPNEGLTIDWQSNLEKDASGKIVKGTRRLGSVDHQTGKWLETQKGTPVPAVVPLKNRPLPVIPTYANNPKNDPNPSTEAKDEMADVANVPANETGEMDPFPGYPYYIAGKAGHRPPQAPMDLALSLKGKLNDDSSYLDGGLPRHTVADGGIRKFGVKGQEKIPAPPSFLRDSNQNITSYDEREALQSQFLAKMLALGDMTAKPVSLDIDLLDYEGTRLERAAMGFHNDGKTWPMASETAKNINVLDVHGNAAQYSSAKGGYETIVSDNNGSTKGFFGVNSAPPKPGAPFADPCGGQPGATGVKIQEPFLKGLMEKPDRFSFHTDPKVAGFRRYEASAVQLDLITNRAGWHDPQARINVLTTQSHRYKLKKDDPVFKSGLKREDAISPVISANEEPFFFRAYSGECIEFRHTNELPKDLELDDFQVRTPTDTIGQHIHLVKFDATASDGSGNGFNYEDGTFAPDEIAARICAAKTAGEAVQEKREDQKLAIRAAADFCKVDELLSEEMKKTVYVPTKKDIWKQPRSSMPELFQTTVQRWFADPVLSTDNRPGQDTYPTDRTLRTVFSHDHFGPSSIQQHGFYTALVIEPPQSQICETQIGKNGEVACDDKYLAMPGKNFEEVVDANEMMVGVNRAIISREEKPEVPLSVTHPDYREYALAVADFALLYDPRDHMTLEQQQQELCFGSTKTPGCKMNANGTGSPKGMAKLVCEAQVQKEYGKNPDPLILKQAYERHCGTNFKADQQTSKHANGSSLALFENEGNFTPAWNAGGRPHDYPMHNNGLLNFLESDEIADLRKHLFHYRRKATLHPASLLRYAKPVNPPVRPESISVDHHDPYLVNYRGEPLPLRIGTADSDTNCDLTKIHMPDTVSGYPNSEDFAHERVTNARKCSVARQRKGQEGNMANVFLSALHGDPSTPMIETYNGERTMFRIIQGAQEVQHNFNVEGYAWKRNFDQVFPSAAKAMQVPKIDNSGPFATLANSCATRNSARDGYPAYYDAYFERGLGAIKAMHVNKFFEDFEKDAASCLNLEGYTTSQEIGISEHFELRGAYRQEMSIGIPKRKSGQSSNSRETTSLQNSDQNDRTEKERTSTDFLYDFGSVDSLWNGAWGLLRVYKDLEAKDYTTCGKDDVAPAECNKTGSDISSRIALLSKIKDQLESTDSKSRGGRRVLGGSGTEVVSCPIEAPIVNAAVAAVNAREIYGDDGLTYGHDLYDPDGLLLLALAPKDASELEVTKKPRQDWIKHLKDFYANIPPEPYVLTAKAGDCVYLTVINLLQENKGNEISGLSDAPGDAPMPAITPLNVSPAMQHEDDENGKRSWSLDAWDAAAARAMDVVPSARLSLRIPLPTLNEAQQISLPFGHNITGALEPMAEALDEGGPSIEKLTFYAGRMWLNTTDKSGNDLTDKMVDKVAVQAFERFLDRVDTQYSGLDANKTLGTENIKAIKTAKADIDIDLLFLGEAYEINFTADNSQPVGRIEKLANDKKVNIDTSLVSKILKEEWDIASRTMVSRTSHWMPYAFGAMPIKSFGDVIGHGVHGLMGAINIVPCDWSELPGRVTVNSTGTQNASANSDETTAACKSPDVMEYEKVYENSSKTTMDVPATEYDITPLEQAFTGNGMAAKRPSLDNQFADVRSFVLFYQDGLNLWDKRSNIEWHYTNPSGGTVKGSDGNPAKFTPECKICDDSYDFGDRGLNYHAPAFFSRLRPDTAPPDPALNLEASDDLNRQVFPDKFFMLKDNEQATIAGGGRPLRTNGQVPVLRVIAGEEVVIGVLEPNGRARQHAFVTISQDYHDLFPDFGFPHSALMGPGKGVNASLVRKTETVDKAQNSATGCYLLHDGPTHLRAGGIFALLDVVKEEDFEDEKVTTCLRSPQKSGQ